MKYFLDFVYRHYLVEWGYLIFLSSADLIYSNTTSSTNDYSLWAFGTLLGFIGTYLCIMIRKEKADNKFKLKFDDASIVTIDTLISIGFILLIGLIPVSIIFLNQY